MYVDEIGNRPVRLPDPPPPPPAPPKVTSHQPTTPDGVDGPGRARRQHGWHLEGDGLDWQPPAAQPALPQEMTVQSPEEAKRKEDEAQVDGASKEFQRSVRDKRPLEATAELNKQLEGLPPELRGRFLEKSAGSIEELTGKLKQLDRGDTAHALKNLARATDLAGPLAAEKITGPMSRAIASGGLEQTDRDAHGGAFGMFRGANVHHSEREFIDGIRDLGDAPGAQLFKDALTSSLAAEGRGGQGERADRATGFASAVATGDPRKVPDRGGWTAVRNAGHGAVDEAQKRLGQVKDAALDQLNDLKNKIVDIGDIDQHIDALGKGDKYNVSLSADACFPVYGVPVKVQGKGELEISKNKDGEYVVSAGGEYGAGIWKEVGTKAGVDGATRDSKGEAGILAGQGGKVEFKFNTAEEAKQGAEALLRLAVMGPAMAGGAAARTPGITAGIASDAAFLKPHLAAVELSQKATAALKGELGLGQVRGVSVSGNLGVEANMESTMRLEFPKPGSFDLPPVLVMKQKLSGKAAGGLEFTPPGKLGGKFGGEIKGEFKPTLEVETRIPLPKGTDVPKLLTEPSGALGPGGKYLMNNATSKVTLTYEFEGGVGGKVKNGPQVAIANGRELKLEVTLNWKDLSNSGAMDHMLHGRVPQALQAAGDKVQVKAWDTSYVVYGGKVSVGAKVVGYGAEVNLAGKRKDIAEGELAPDFEGTGTQAARKLFLGEEPAVATWQDPPALASPSDPGPQVPLPSRAHRLYA
jgi:hypothetical protein